VILLYHSVPDPSIERWIDPRYAVPLKIFDAQMKFLARWRKVIGMSELVSMLECGESAPPGTVVITFDDGYRDTLEFAAPILERHGLPAIVYLSTGSMNRGENQWVDRLYSAFQCRTNQHLRLNGPDAPLVDLGRRHNLFEAFDAIAGQLVAAERGERKALFEAIESQLRPREGPPRLMLDWGGAKELLRRYPRIEVGVHTREHVDLTACGEAEARAELTSSINDVARELGVKVEHFAFPYGRSNARIREIVAESPLRSAVVGAPVSLIRRDTDRFAMPRVEVCRSITQLRFQTCGAYPDLPMALLART
jgi:peptidoglycan/xylan/chitin deacetylase (PgdA/CDA1 family)